MQILNMYEVEGEEEIYIYIDVGPNVAPLQMKMPKCYTSKPNARIKYFSNKNGNKVILIVGEEDLAEENDGVGLGEGEGATTTMGIGRDDKSCGVILMLVLVVVVEVWVV